MMTAPFLSRPDMRYRESFLAATLEKMQEGRRPNWNYDMLDVHFDEYIKVLLARETDPIAGNVPQSDFWLIVDEQYAGNISLRHYLNDKLKRFGGHIGYEIRPAMRRRGYGTVMCGLVLPEAKKRGLKRVLITCDDTNIGSQKIIEANGGVLQDKINNGRAVLTRRYWITLDS